MEKWYQDNIKQKKDDIALSISDIVDFKTIIIIMSNEKQSYCIMTPNISCGEKDRNRLIFQVYQLNGYILKQILIIIKLIKFSKKYLSNAINKHNLADVYKELCTEEYNKAHFLRCIHKTMIKIK